MTRQQSKSTLSTTSNLQFCRHPAEVIAGACWWCAQVAEWSPGLLAEFGHLHSLPVFWLSSLGTRASADERRLMLKGAACPKHCNFSKSSLTPSVLQWSCSPQSSQRLEQRGRSPGRSQSSWGSRSRLAPLRQSVSGCKAAPSGPSCSRRLWSAWRPECTPVRRALWSDRF